MQQAVNRSNVVVLGGCVAVAVLVLSILLLRAPRVAAPDLTQQDIIDRAIVVARQHPDNRVTRVVAQRQIAAAFGVPTCTWMDRALHWVDPTLEIRCALKVEIWSVQMLGHFRLPHDTVTNNLKVDVAVDGTIMSWGTVR